MRPARQSSVLCLGCCGSAARDGAGSGQGTGPSVPPSTAGLGGQNKGRSGGSRLCLAQGRAGGGAGAQTAACGCREMVLRDRRGLCWAAPAPPAPAPPRPVWAPGGHGGLGPPGCPGRGPSRSCPASHSSVREWPRSVSLHPLLTKPCD